jgi:nucleotide-binding universal stress UspA family protein
MGTARHERDARYMPKPIIAAVDPLREDVAPAALGLLLARLTSAPLVLAAAYAVDLYVDSLYPEYARNSRQTAEEAMRRVGALVEQTPGAPVSVATAVTPTAGIPARALHGLASREEAAMIVIGSSDRGRIGRVLPSAVTDRLLHGAPCPVAVAPVGFSFDDAAAGVRLIGAAFTDTHDGHAALATACTLARSARALVRVLTVAEPLQSPMTSTLDAMALEDVRDRRDAAAETTLRRGLDAVPVGRSAGGEILSGDPADALAAASADFGLLVCGSRGYGPIRTLLLGGTSHALVRKAASPILVVPPSSPAHATGRPERTLMHSGSPTP